jgi:hypothetical protein
VCNANAEELIGSMRTVRSFGAEEQEVRHYSGGLDLLLGFGFRQAYAYVLPYAAVCCRMLPYAAVC